MSESRKKEDKEDLEQRWLATVGWLVRYMIISQFDETLSYSERLDNTTCVYQIIDPNIIIITIDIST